MAYDIRICLDCYHVFPGTEVECTTCSSTNWGGKEEEPVYDLRISEGYTSDVPAIPGIYLAACSESEFEPYEAVIRRTGSGLVVRDPEIGDCHLDSYDLTDLLFKRIGDLLL